MESMGTQQEVQKSVVESTHPILLYDGVCNFCNKTVQFIIQHDKKGLIHFASLQSTFGQQKTKEAQLPTQDLKSLLFIDKGQIYSRSSGALRISKYLNGAWKLLYVFIIIPKPFRDIIYNFIAKNRYKWFGKTEECILPSPDIRSRFLQD